MNRIPVVVAVKSTENLCHVVDVVPVQSTTAPSKTDGRYVAFPLA
jgi:hypothetical protein